MRQYLECIQQVLGHGEEVTDRTGVGTISVFGYQMRFDLNDGFPAVTTKKLAWKSVVAETLWYLEGSTDERRLAELVYAKDRYELKDKRTVWTDNANAQGVALGYVNNDNYKGLGPTYGEQYRDSNGVDQIEKLLSSIKSNPNSRRHILNLWNVGEIDNMALPPCLFMAQFHVRNEKLSCHTFARSQDLFLGTPFNLAQYALLTHIIARECGLGVGELIHTLGDAHIYLNHIEQVKKQLLRYPCPLPTLKIDDDFDLSDRLINGFRLDDVKKFQLLNYQHHATIKAPMAV